MLIVEAASLTSSVDREVCAILHSFFFYTSGSGYGPSLSLPPLLPPLCTVKGNRSRLLEL